MDPISPHRVSCPSLASTSLVRVESSRDLLRDTEGEREMVFFFFKSFLFTSL